MALAVIFYSATMYVLMSNNTLPLTTSSSSVCTTPTMNILLYMGETEDGKFGFGYSSNTLTSPGPTLRFTTSDVLNITVLNVGKMSHAFAITSAPRTGARVLFNAEIGSAVTPLQPGQSGSVIFTPNNAGSSFFYTCPIAGQAEAGMYGSIVISTVSGSAGGM
jgi:uncharacterized cupredoxin-like copper-binding protein